LLVIWDFDYDYDYNGHTMLTASQRVLSSSYEDPTYRALRGPYHAHRRPYRALSGPACSQRTLPHPQTAMVPANGTMPSAMQLSVGVTTVSEGLHTHCSQSVLPCSQRTLPCSQKAVPCFQMILPLCQKALPCS